MRRLLLIIVFALAGVVLVIAGVMIGLYAAMQRVPQRYRNVLKADPAAQAEASDKMLQQATALASDVEDEGRWQALFSADEINGWLAVDMVENHPDLLPQGVSDPRVVIEPEDATLFSRVERGSVTSVVSLSVDAYIQEPNVMAVRIRRARAGVLPLPMEKILERITEAAGKLDLRIRWRQTDGDPVALVSLPPTWDGDDKLVSVEELRFGEGEIFVSGTTENRPPEADDDDTP